MTCPADIEVECSTAGGVPANDPQLTDFFAAFMAEDNCDGDLDIGNDAPAFFDGPCEGGGGVTVVTWTATDDAGNPKGRGVNVVRLAADGRIASVVGFW